MIFETMFRVVVCELKAAFKIILTDHVVLIVNIYCCPILILRVSFPKQ